MSITVFEVVTMFLFLLQISIQAYFTQKCIVGMYVFIYVCIYSFFMVLQLAWLIEQRMLVVAET